MSNGQFMQGWVANQGRGAVHATAHVPNIGPFVLLREFLASLPRLRTPDALSRAISTVSTPLALPKVMCGALLAHGDSLDGRLYFSNWTTSGHRAYAEGWFGRDPMMQEARRHLSPFTWRAFASEAAPEAVGDVDRFLEGEGCQERVVVPIHGPAGYVGLVMFAGPAGSPLSPAVQAILVPLAHAAHERGRELHATEMPRAVPRLTARERQVMRWIANGKTDAEIGRIFSISATTVHSYAEQAKRKLGARSRPQAVSEMALFELL